MKFSIKALVATAVLGLLAGCTGPATAPPTATSSPTAFTITDQAGREVTLKAAATKVFGAGPPGTLMVYAFDPSLLAGWNSQVSEVQKPFLEKSTLELPVLGRASGSGKDTFNAEVLSANQVDLIIDAGDINDQVIATNDELQSKTGIPVVTLSTDPAKMAEAFELLGKVTGNAARGTELSAETTRITAAIDAGAKAVPADAKKSIFYSVGAQGLSTALSGSINARVIDTIGATNVAGTTDRSGRVEITAEQILTFNPDWVVFSPDNPTDEIATNPAAVQPVGSLSAVTEGRFLVIPNNQPWGWFDGPPAVNQLMGMMWAGQAIYPDQYQLDISKELVSFYKNYYHYEMSTDEAKKMLATAHTPGF